MDKFSKTFKFRMGILVLYNFIIIALICIGLFHPVTGNSDFSLGFMSGINVGTYMFFQILIIRTIIKYNSALRNDDLLKKLYIYENDERRLFIHSKIGGSSINIILFTLAAATIASGFFDETVYFTLLSTLIFCVLVKGVLKLYYNRKV